MSEQPEALPLVVYRLAHLPRALRDLVPADDPVHACCFYAGVAEDRIRAAIDEAFRVVPEPACEAEPGMTIAGKVLAALRATDVATFVFLAHSRARATHTVSGFHAGAASAFRAALTEAGLTLIEGGDLFRTRLHFVQASTPIVTRWLMGGSLAFVRAHEVGPAPEGGTLYAYASPLAGRTDLVAAGRMWFTLLGLDGRWADPPAAGFGDAPVPWGLAPAAPGLDDAPWAPPTMARALGAGDPEGEGAANLLVQWSADTATLSSDALEHVARTWLGYLLSREVTGRMGLFGQAVVRALEARLGGDRVADLVVSIRDATSPSP